MSEENITDTKTQTMPSEEQPNSNISDKNTQIPDNETNANGLVYPANTDDAAAVLSFRKSCGYPDEAKDYGLPMDTEEQKSLVNFIHKCQLDPIAAKAVAQNVAEVLATEEQQAKQVFNDNYNKVVSSWGENSQANLSLVNKGLSLMKIDEDKLRGISENIGVETALSMMILLGKTQTDYSGVSGGNGNDSESLLDYISRKRG